MMGESLEKFFGVLLKVSKLLKYSEKTLTGHSRFHISTPRGFEPGSIVMGSNRVVHWTSKRWWEWSEIAGSPQGYPPAADSAGCEAGRGTCSKHETRTEELCDQVNPGLHIVGTEPSKAPTEGQVVSQPAPEQHLPPSPSWVDVIITQGERYT
jgi:hypothetical protein